jgi:MFS superfamily sulfate permease-like transporter
MLGIPGISTGDPAYKVAIATFKNLGKTRLDAAMGVTALVVLYLIRFACDKASKRYPSKKRFYFFLSTLRTVFVILLFTLISWLVNRNHRTSPKFAILGHIPRGNLYNVLCPWPCSLKNRIQENNCSRSRHSGYQSTRRPDPRRYNCPPHRAYINCQIVRTRQQLHH